MDKYYYFYIAGICLTVIGLIGTIVGVALFNNTVFYVGQGIQLAGIVVMAVVIYLVYRQNKANPAQKAKFFELALSTSLLTTAIALLIFSNSLMPMCYGYSTTADMIFDIVILAVLALCVIITWVSFVFHRRALKNIKAQEAKSKA